MIQALLTQLVGSIAKRVADEAILYFKKEMEAMAISKEAEVILDEYELADSTEEREAILRKIADLHRTI